MSTPAQVYTALVTALKNSADLSYISDNAIFLGARERIDNFPTLLIEEGSVDEENIDINGYVNLRMQATIHAVTTAVNVDKQIVGDTNYKGTADIVNDVKKAISADPTLGAVVIDSRFMVSTPNIDEWPLRSVQIGIEILFRQHSTSRT